jgi:hypothetical protein
VYNREKTQKNGTFFSCSPEETAPPRSTGGLLFTIQCRSTSHRFAVGNPKANSTRMKIASVPDWRSILCGKDFRAAKTSLTLRVGVGCILPDTLARTAKRNRGSVSEKHTNPKRSTPTRSVSEETSSPLFAAGILRFQSVQDG